MPICLYDDPVGKEKRPNVFLVTMILVMRRLRCLKRRNNFGGYPAILVIVFFHEKIIMYGDLTKKQFWLLLFCAYGCMFGQGFIDNTRSVTFPLIRDDLHLTSFQYGMLQAMTQFSYLIWSLSTAISLQKFGFKAIIVAAFVVSALGCFGTAFVHHFWVMFLFQFIAFAGLGVLDDAPHSMSSILFKSNTGVFMLLLHSCYGLGAVFGPAFAGVVSSKLPQYSFRGICMLSCIPMLLLGLIIACIPFAIKKPKSEEQEKNHQGLTVKTALASPMVWFQSVILILLATGERATSAWGGLYLEDVLHLRPDVEGAWFNSCFYIAFTVARLVGGVLVDWLGAFTMEYIVLICAAIVFAVGLSVGKAGVYILPFAGMFVSFFWPTFIVTCMRYWKDDAAIPVSLILPIQGSFGILIQLLLGWMNDTFGPACAYWSTVVVITIAFVLFLIYHRIVINKEKKEAEQLIQEEKNIVSFVCYNLLYVFLSITATTENKVYIMFVQ